MKLRTKMITSVVMAILVMSMLVVGVFAVKDANFQVGGNITFNAKGIYATISAGSLTNCSFTDGSVAGTDKLKPITINTDKTETQINKEFESWQGLKLKFADDMSADKTTATLTFTIKNTAEANSNEYIDISVTTSATEMKNATISVANSKNAGSYVLQPQEALTYTITFKITDTTANASLSGFAINFNMQRLTALPTIEYSKAQEKGLDFDFDFDGDITNTASVKSASTAPTGALEIPRMVTKDGVNYTVTRISDSAFKDCAGITSVTIPSTIKEIGERAFQSCGNLTNVTLPSNLKQIGFCVFQFCESLQDLTLPEGLEFIGDAAFNHCSGVTNTTLRIPSSIKQIGGKTYDPANPDTNIIGSPVFYNMAVYNLVSFEIDSSNPYYMVVDGVLYRKENGVPTVLVAYPPAKTDSVYRMPDTVVDAYELSLSRPYSLHEIVLSDNFIIKEMSSEYLNSNWANNLSAMIYIYSGVTTVTCKETNENYMSYKGQVYSKDGTILYYAPMLSRLSPDSSETATLTLKAGVTTIFHGAIGYESAGYKGSSSLKRYDNIVIPSTVTNIEEKTLTYINKLTWNISIEEGNTTYTINASGKIEKIV